MANPRVLLSTTHGDITIELFEDAAPETVANFLAYVDEGFYEGTVFHRVIPGFMVQGGGLDSSLRDKPNKKAPVQNEACADAKNSRGSLAMARTADPHSATSQFFVNVADNPHLNHSAKTPHGYGYCVFGQVVDGMDVVEAIEKLPTGNRGPHSDVPKETVEITSAKRVED